MREVDSSETSVVWPAWCYSGETVNEDLPQATPASLLHQHHQQQQQQQRFLQLHHQQQQQQQQQSSSNQSQPSSSCSPSPSSSASPSPPSSSHLVAGQGAGKLSSSARRRSNSSGGKRKSITSTSPGPHQQTLTAALATAAAAAAAAAFQASPRRSNPPTPTSASGLQLAALVSENGNGRRGSPSSHPSTPPTHDDGGHYSPLNISNNNNNISSSNFNNQVAALQSLDKMLSERMYDRKKFLNSPTAGSAAAAAAAAAAASSFYEKLRNGAAEMELTSQLNLIKNGQSPLAASDLSAIGSNNGGNSGSGSSANGGAVGGLLATANGTSGGNNSASPMADGNNSGNSLSNSNNQNSSNVHNASSSSSTGSIGNNSNNNSIKSERFSPTNNDVQSTASRSRSVTPSSFSGTPPQTMHVSDVAFPSSISTSGLLPSPNSGMAGGRHEFQVRNYSDIMRSLAAKYHNNNNNISPGTNNSNDQSSVKNPFLEPKMRINQPKSFTDGPLLGSKKSSPITSTQVPNPSIMSSLFPGLPFQSSVFPPLIDMSSTQALVALARAAKESGIHNLLKPEDGGLKKPAAGSRSSSPSSLGATSLASHHFPSPFPSRYLPGILPNHLSSSVSYPTALQTTTTTAVPAISPLKSPTRPTEGGLLSSSTFPLDLSSAAGCGGGGSAPPAAKRIKLSPTPSRNQETSPAPSSTNSQPSDSMELKLGMVRKCHARIEEISAWTVDNVCDFVGSIDICAEYVQNFRDQSIDGAGLPLLTEEHLTNSLGMKLGPALKLKSMLAKKLGGPCPCALCAAPTPTRSGSSNKGDTTPTNRPPSNGSVG